MAIRNGTRKRTRQQDDIYVFKQDEVVFVFRSEQDLFLGFSCAIWISVVHGQRTNNACEA